MGVNKKKLLQIKEKYEQRIATLERDLKEAQDKLLKTQDKLFKHESKVNDAALAILKAHQVERNNRCSPEKQSDSVGIDTDSAAEITTALALDDESAQKNSRELLGRIGDAIHTANTDANMLHEQLTQLQAELLDAQEQLRDESKEANVELQDIKKEHKATCRELQNAHGEIESLKQSLRDNNAKITSFEDVKQGYESKCGDNAEEIAEVRKTNAMLEDQLSQARAKNDILEQRLEKANESLKIRASEGMCQAIDDATREARVFASSLESQATERAAERRFAKIRSAMDDASVVQVKQNEVALQRHAMLEAESLRLMYEAEQAKMTTGTQPRSLRAHLLSEIAEVTA